MTKTTPRALSSLHSHIAWAAAAVTLLAPAAAVKAQTSSSSSSSVNPSASVPGSPVAEAMHDMPFSWGPFFNGGVGTSDRSDYRFLSAGIRASKVLTAPAGPGLLRGQFAYGVEVMPWWQGYAPPFERYNVTRESDGTLQEAGPYRTGGSYNGVSVTPILLRWDFTGGRRVLPFAQGGGGLIWTNHKFPPVGPLPAVGHGGASVWNFTPQFGVGMEYFLRPKRSILLGANAVHISSASLGDANPGVNASIQFQIGYSWWK